MTFRGLCVKTFPAASITDLEPKYGDKTGTWGDSTKRGKNPSVAGDKTGVKIGQKKIYGSGERSWRVSDVKNFVTMKEKEAEPVPLEWDYISTLKFPLM